MELILVVVISAGMAGNSQNGVSRSLKRQSSSIGKVRQATRFLFEINTYNYVERLQIVMLPSLKYRRMRGDMIQMYNIIHGIDEFDWILFCKN